MLSIICLITVMFCVVYLPVTIYRCTRFFYFLSIIVILFIRVECSRKLELGDLDPCPSNCHDSRVPWITRALCDSVDVIAYSQLPL